MKAKNKIEDGLIDSEPEEKCKRVFFKIIIPVGCCFLAAYLQGKIGIREINLAITSFGAVFYAFVGASYLVLFIMDGQRRMCNLHYAVVGFLFSGMTVCWIRYAQLARAYPEWLDFLYGWVTLYMFVILCKKPLVLISKIRRQRKQYETKKDYDPYARFDILKRISRHRTLSEKEQTEFFQLLTIMRGYEKNIEDGIDDNTNK